MPRSRKFRKSQNQVKPEWGKNNPQTKAKNKKLMIIGGIIAVAVVIGASLTVMGLNGMFSSPSNSPSPSASPTPKPIPRPSALPLVSPVGEYSANGTVVVFETSMGNVFIQLRDDKPITTTNFKNIIEQGMFDNTVFHRVIANFMIQGGQITGSVPSIVDEIGNDNRNSRGTIAMAKTSSPNSATSEFFINVVDNGYNAIDQAGTRFDTVYTAFGTVIQGMDVVDAISKVAVGPNPITGENSQPLQAVTLIRASIVP